MFLCEGLLAIDFWLSSKEWRWAGSRGRSLSSRTSKTRLSRSRIMITSHSRKSKNKSKVCQLESLKRAEETLLGNLKALSINFIKMGSGYSWIEKICSKRSKEENNKEDHRRLRRKGRLRTSRVPSSRTLKRRRTLNHQRDRQKVPPTHRYWAEIDSSQIWEMWGTRTQPWAASRSAWATAHQPCCQLHSERVSARCSKAPSTALAPTSSLNLAPFTWTGALLQPQSSTHKYAPTQRPWSPPTLKEQAIMPILLPKLASKSA